MISKINRKQPKKIKPEIYLLISFSHLLYYCFASIIGFSTGELPSALQKASHAFLESQVVCTDMRNISVFGYKK